jgi:phospholipid/cholesterol/gamma-HCH transport system substrate-binding protein
MREPSKGMDREIQVGLFVFLASVIIAAFSFRITDSPVFRSGKPFVIYLTDATGIFKNSKVKMAGIDIGVIQKIELENTRAKLTLLIDQEHEIPKNAVVVPRPLGILGDKYLEVQVPENKENPNSILEDTPTKNNGPSGSLWWDWFIPSAEAQTNAKNSAQPGSVLRSKENAATMDDVLRKVGDASEDLKSISSDINGFVKANKRDLTEFIQSINRISKKIENTLNEVDTQQLSHDIKALTKSAGELSKSIEHINSIAEKIDEGQGTLGKLVNDPTGSTTNALPLADLKRPLGPLR